MPPKLSKDAAKSLSNELYYEQQKLLDDVNIITLRLAALKNVYLARMEQNAVCKQNLITLTRSLHAKQKTLHDSESKRTDILTDYVRQNKVDEQTGIEQIIKLQNARDTLREERLDLQKALTELESEYDEKIKVKRSEHEALCQRLVDMQKEFNVMLADVAKQ